VGAGFFTFGTRAVTTFDLMAKAPRSSKSRKAKKVVIRDPELDRLIEVAKSLGLDVREERLHREVGYSVHSGLCRVEGDEVLLLDKNAEPSELIEALCEILSARDLEAIYIEPELRSRILESAAVVDAKAESAEPTPPSAAA
jgi:signal recognition particle subunit SEC65